MKRTMYRVLAIGFILGALVVGHWPQSTTLVLAQDAVQTTNSEASPSPRLPASTTNAPPTGPAATLRNPNLPVSFPANPKVATIRINGEIREFTYNNLVHRMEEAKDGGADVIVIELDTPGGRLDASMKISKFIKGFSLPTVAWVHREAYSGGIMTAAACDLIVMADPAAAGDCAPIAPGVNLAPAERAKLVSPILTEFRDSAIRSGVDYTLYHAMVEVGVEVYRVRLPATGEERLVNQADHDIMVKGEDPQAVRNKYQRTQSAITPQGPIGITPSGGPPVQPGIWPEETVPDDQRGRWTEVAVVHDGKTLLTMTQDEALAADLSRGTVADETALGQFLGAATIYPISTSWASIAADFLSKPWVRGLLIAVMLIGAYVEFQAPGLGLPGAVAVTALVLLIGAPYLIGLSRIWHIIIFGIGVIMLAIEIFTPTFGIIGIGGIFLMLAGLALMVVPSNSYGMPQYDMLGRLAYSMTFTLLGVVAAAVSFYFISKHFGSIPLLNRMILGDAEPLPQGPGLLNPRAGTVTRTSGDDALGEGELKVGDVGKTLTTLRPSGQASVGGYTVDVISVGAMLDPGQRVKIVAIDGNRIQVDQAD